MRKTSYWVYGSWLKFHLISRTDNRVAYAYQWRKFRDKNQITKLSTKQQSARLATWKTIVAEILNNKIWESYRQWQRLVGNLVGSKHNIVKRVEGANSMLKLQFSFRGLIFRDKLAKVRGSHSPSWPSMSSASTYGILTVVKTNSGLTYTQEHWHQEPKKIT
jgi:hypothetical protein